MLSEFTDHFLFQVNRPYAYFYVCVCYASISFYVIVGEKKVLCDF